MKRRWFSPLKIAILLFILAIFIVLFLPLAMQVKRTLDTRTKKDHLREIGAAIIKASQQKVTLSQAICSPDGKPMLSWRVAILPYLDDPEAKALYLLFKLDEPWDSPSNAPLLEHMPTVFASPGMEVPVSHTLFQVFVTAPGYEQGKYRPLWNKYGPMNHAGSFNTIPDGPSATILVAEVGKPVPWTKPEDILIDKTIQDDATGFDFKVDLFKFTPGWLRFEVVMADGTLRTMHQSMYDDKNKLMKKLIRPFIGCMDGDTVDDGK